MRRRLDFSSRQDLIARERACLERMRLLCPNTRARIEVTTVADRLDISVYLSAEAVSPAFRTGSELSAAAFIRENL